MFQELLAKLSKKLDQYKIPYMVTGGQAVLLYGEPRFTKDIDLTVGISNEHLSEIIQMVKELKLKVIPEEAEPFVRDTMVLPLIDEKSGIRVDIVFSFTPYEAQALQRTKKIQLKNAHVSFISVEDLIVHKIFAGRPRDLEDLEAILKKNRDFDSNYIAHWLGEFDKTVKDRNFLATFTALLKK